jgi:hypothetical protein
LAAARLSTFSTTQGKPDARTSAIVGGMLSQ